MPEIEKTQHEHTGLYQVDLPYPSIEHVKPNRYYAELLSTDYAGANGELTAILQYSQHSFRLDALGNSHAHAMMGIAIVEMHHLKLLAGIIQRCGGTAHYTDLMTRRNWGSGYVRYSGQPSMMIRADMEAEQMAIRTYKGQLSVIKDEAIRAVIKRIILDEELHLQLFSRMLHA